MAPDPMLTTYKYNSAYILQTPRELLDAYNKREKAKLHKILLSIMIVFDGTVVERNDPPGSNMWRGLHLGNWKDQNTIASNVYGKLSDFKSLKITKPEIMEPASADLSILRDFAVDGTLYVPVVVSVTEYPLAPTPATSPASQLRMTPIANLLLPPTNLYISLPQLNMMVTRAQLHTKAHIISCDVDQLKEKRTAFIMSFLEAWWSERRANSDYMVAIAYKRGSTKKGVFLIETTKEVYCRSSPPHGAINQESIGGLYDIRGWSWRDNGRPVLLDGPQGQDEPKSSDELEEFFEDDGRSRIQWLDGVEDQRWLSRREFGSPENWAWLNWDPAFVDKEFPPKNY